MRDTASAAEARHYWRTVLGFRMNQRAGSATTDDADELSVIASYSKNQAILRGIAALLEGDAVARSGS